MTIICIVYLTLIILSIIGIINADNNTVSGIFGGFAIGIIVSIITLLILFNKPQAIDVYRGNTILEITYQDNIPIDSVVVFKN